MTPNDHRASRRRRNTVTITSVATIAAVTVGVFGISEYSSGPIVASAAAAPTSDSGVDGLVSDALPDTNPTIDQVASPAFRNVVMILADDLDWKLFDQIPRLNALKAQGTTFTNHTVVDSLCCPSRVTIMRGQYIHNHGVVSNIEATGGGWPTFQRLDADDDCLPVWLNDAGVTTALYGKYLNEYPTRPDGIRYVPPGWDEWAVPISRGDSYSGYSYTLNDNGELVRYGTKATDFWATSSTTKPGTSSAQHPEPFFLYLSTYTPHKPFATAPRHLSAHAGTAAPRTPAYNSFPGKRAGMKLRQFPQLSDWAVANWTSCGGKRARSAETVADSVEAVLAELEATGRDKDTLVIVTSDNGYHVGEYQVPKGKRTPYAADTVVPMIAIGPGVPCRRRGVRDDVHH